MLTTIKLARGTPGFTYDQEEIQIFQGPEKEICLTLCDKDGKAVAGASLTVEEANQLCAGLRCHVAAMKG